jgi:hypothetical protein
MAKLSPLAMGEEAAEAKGMALHTVSTAKKPARERLAVNLMRGRAAGTRKGEAGVLGVVFTVMVVLVVVIVVSS